MSLQRDAIDKPMSKEYRYNEVINLHDFLNDEDFEIMKKLKIQIKNKIYTKFEFDCLYLEISRYDIPSKNDFTLYGNYTEEETIKKFKRIFNEGKLTEREKVLLNMYVIAARSDKIETFRQNPEEKGVTRNRYNELLKSFNNIKEKYKL